MLADPAFREEVCDFQGVTRKTVVIEPVGEGMHVTIDQWQRTSGVPSFAKKFVGEETNIVQREIWSTPLLGDISVTIPGKPGDMTGTARIDEAHGVTTETVDLDDQGRHPAGRRQARGPDLRPAAQGAQGREQGRPRLPGALTQVSLVNQ